MSTEPLPTRQALAARAERAGAAIGYVLLLVAPFTLGVLALVAIALAWLRRGAADPVAASHYRYQIRSFIGDLVLLVLSLVVAGAAIAGGALSLFGAKHLPFGLQPGPLGAWAVGLAVLWGVLWLWGLIGLFVGSARGLMRLAAGRPIGRTPRSA